MSTPPTLPASATAGINPTDGKVQCGQVTTAGAAPYDNAGYYVVYIIGKYS